MYKRQVGARAADGIASHGSLDAYIGDFHACSKAFEMFVADRLSAAATGSQPSQPNAFLLWEDLDAATKEARGLTKADAGVDVTDGATTLVQCKLRARYLTWRECATFFASAVSFTDGAYVVPWQSLLLARNACSTLSRTLAELGASRPFDFPVHLSEFRAYAQDCFAEHTSNAHEAAASVPIIDAAATAHRFRDYQLEAIDLCVKETPRAAYVALPTGCGKSLVMAHVAARLGLRVVVLVPLVVLLEQILEVLATFGCAGTEVTSVTAVGGGLTTTGADIETARVVVCVYNSAHKLNLAAFDRILIDEAHFVRVPAMYADLTDSDEESDDLEDDSQDESVIESVDASTPSPSGSSGSSGSTGSTGSTRSTGPTSAGSAGSAGSNRSQKNGYAAVRAATTLASARLFSATLDVPDGAERCTRSLREMITAGCLCDYTLNVPVFEVGATSADLARHLVREYRSIIVFCATRAEGVSFCAAINDHGPSCARYIDCDTPRGERREVIAAFKTGELAFIVNVRVLSVGFDAPITKGVCFVNMPASKTHIVQVIGRCLRLHPDKRIAHVILPLIAGTHDEDKRARDFMRVLAQNDSRFAQALRAGGGGYVAVSRVARDETEGSAEASEIATELLYTAVYDSMGRAITDAWSTRFDELLAFYEANGHTPPQSTPGGLGQWVSTQRQDRETMNAERKARLEALDWWVWRARARPVRADWSTKLDELVAYHAQHGRVPIASTPGGLGMWVVTQRAKRDTMAAEHKARLAAMDWWVWSVRAAYVRTDWSTKLEELVAYHAEHGRIPPFATPRLGTWVDTQRQRRASMSEERRARLEALPWWVWNALDNAWSTKFDELVAFYEANGMCPPRSAPGGLGPWVHIQRRDRETMDAERRARLDALEWWVWDPLDDSWATQFDELVAYHAGHGRLPTTKTARSWVVTQRTARGIMDDERKAKLEALEWWTWNPFDDAWSTQFEQLVAYHAECGMLPLQSTPVLGSWVNQQRTRRATMSSDRKARLDALPWWVWSVREAHVRTGWDARYDELVAYHAEHGRIPPQSTPGLGAWVSDQRTSRSTVHAERKARLDALPWWVWDPLDDAWSTKFDELVAYHAEHGRIPPFATPRLGSWVDNQRQTRASMAPERKARLDALPWWVWRVRGGALELTV